MKKNVAVIFGGCSPEYNVSLQSAAAVIRNLDAEKYNPVLIGITRTGDWLHYTGPVERIEQNTWHDGKSCTPVTISLNSSHPGLLCIHENKTTLLPLDAAFPVLHGRNGEDGTVQGLLTLAKIPLAGCGILSSALCMDKFRAHQMAAAANILIPKSLVINTMADIHKAQDFACEIGYPLFVKPIKAGSSFGITRVTVPSSLQTAIETAFQYDDEVVLEENIEGFEVGCAILGTQDYIVGEVDEIELSQGFFDFTEKYTLKSSSIHVPARIDKTKALEIKETATRIYRVLGCTGFARVDMFLTPAGEIVFNEVNTIPGFTEHSRYPGMMKAAGFSFGDILDKIIGQAVIQ